MALKPRHNLHRYIRCRGQSMGGKAAAYNMEFRVYWILGLLITSHIFHKIYLFEMNYWNKLRWFYWAAPALLVFKRQQNKIMKKEFYFIMQNLFTCSPECGPLFTVRVEVLSKGVRLHKTIKQLEQVCRGHVHVHTLIWTWFGFSIQFTQSVALVRGYFRKLPDNLRLFGFTYSYSQRKVQWKKKFIIFIFFFFFYLGSSHVLSIFFLAGCWVEDYIVYGLN